MPRTKRNKQVKPTTMQVPPGFTLLLITDKTNGMQTATLLRTLEQYELTTIIKNYCKDFANSEAVEDWEAQELRVTLHPKHIYELAKLIREVIAS